jgi:hypothetical protein
MGSRPSGDALHLLRLMRDTPAHEGVEGDRAEVQSSRGRNATRVLIDELAGGLRTETFRNAPVSASYSLQQIGQEALTRPRSTPQ